jgi:hypothetical protein
MGSLEPGAIGSVERFSDQGRELMMVFQKQAPNPEEYDQVLRSFQEWMADRARAANPGSGEGSSDRGPDGYFSPLVDSLETSVAPDQEGVTEESATYRTPVGRRALRTTVRGFILVVLAGLVWQVAQDATTRDALKAWAQKTWAHSLNWLSPVIDTKSQPSSDVAAGTVSKPSDQKVTLPQTAAQSPDTAASRTVPAAAQPTEVPPVLQQRLDGLVGDLAAVRRVLEQLAATQDQMARDLMSLQAAEQEMSQRIAPPAQTAVVHARPRRQAPKPAQMEAPQQPAAVSLAPPPSDAQPTGDKPLRPPQPLTTPPSRAP